MGALEELGEDIHVRDDRVKTLHVLAKAKLCAAIG
jgi:hypothetical protein